MKAPLRHLANDGAGMCTPLNGRERQPRRALLACQTFADCFGAISQLGPSALLVQQVVVFILSAQTLILFQSSATAEVLTLSCRTIGGNGDSFRKVSFLHADWGRYG